MPCRRASAASRSRWICRSPPDRRLAGYRGCRRTVDGRLGGCGDGLVAVQSEVVVGGKVDDRAPVDRGCGAGAAIVQPVKRVGDAGDVAERAFNLQDLVFEQGLSNLVSKRCDRRKDVLSSVAAGMGSMTSWGLLEDMAHFVDRLLRSGTIVALIRWALQSHGLS